MTAAKKAWKTRCARAAELFGERLHDACMRGLPFGHRFNWWCEADNSEQMIFIVSVRKPKSILAEDAQGKR